MPRSVPRLVRNAALAFSSQLATAGFTAAITLFLLRALSPTQFGIYSLAFAVVGVLALPADFGLAHATARFVAEHQDDPDAARAVVADAFRLKLLSAVVVCGGLALAAGPIASAYDEPALVWPLRGFALALFAQTFMTFFTYVFVAQERFGVNLRIVASESAAEAAATFSLVLALGGAGAAAAGRAAGYGLGALAATAAAWRTFGRLPLVRRTHTSGVRTLAGYAGALLVVDAAYTLFEQIDVLLIGAYLGAAAAGVFQAPLRLATFLFYPAAALSAVVTPRLAGARTGDAVARFRAVTRVVAAVQALLIAPVVAWATPIMHLLGPGYADSPKVLRALAPYIFLTGFGLLYSVAANYLGEARRRISVALAALLVNVVVDVILIPRIGVVGGAVGSDVAFAVYTAASFWICARILDLRVGPLLLTLARCLAAGAAAAGVLAGFGTATLSLVDWLVAPLLAVAAFGAVLAVTRELSPADVGAVRRHIRPPRGG